MWKILHFRFFIFDFLEERDHACAEINALKTQNNCFASDNSFSDRTKNGEDEIKALKIALQQANQEKTQFEAEISRLKDENESMRSTFLFCFILNGRMFFFFLNNYCKALGLLILFYSL